MNKKLIKSLRLPSDSTQLLNRIVDMSTSKMDKLAYLFSSQPNHDLEYFTPDGIIKGHEALEEFISNPQNRGKAVYAKPSIFADLALEGGGAYGFGHLGVVHATSIQGIGFDRISGTSAGAIAGALLAAGYRVDLNYQFDVEQPVRTPLVPSVANSANKIIFEDLYKPFTDMPIDRNDVLNLLDDSWFIKLMEEKMDFLIQKFIVERLNNRMIDYDLLGQAMSQIVIQYYETNGMGILLDIPLIPNDSWTTPRAIIVSAFIGLNSTIDAMISATQAFETYIAESIRNILIRSIKDAFANAILKDTDQVKNYGLYGMLRLSQKGGFWDGIYIRNWLESHLQEMVEGTGELLDGSDDSGIRRPLLHNADLSKGKHRRSVTFKDLPIDLCITTTAVGELGEPFDPRNVRIVYFSKKTSPDYPVAEAVRRSMSLPFVFIPRDLSDGYAKIEQVRKTTDYNPMDVFESPSDIDYSKDSFVPDGSICLDGGFQVNLPISVFRDTSNEIFECPIEHGEFSKLLVISNLSMALKTNQRPFDVPVPKIPQPLKDLKPIADFIALLFKMGGPPPSTGMEKANFAFWTTINSTPLGAWKDFDIDLLLQVVPNSILIETPIFDPNYDNRLSGGEFAMPKTTKKWLLSNGFEAVRKAFSNFAVENPGVFKNFSMDKVVNPYLHLLKISNLNLDALVIPEFPEQVLSKISGVNTTPAKLGDTIYKTSNETIVAAKYNNGFGDYPFGQGEYYRYKGLGYTWIKTDASSDMRRNNDEVFLQFQVNLRCKVTVLCDIKPDFVVVDDWDEEVWHVVTQSGAILRAFSKPFEKGQVTIPGPRFGFDRANNQFAMGFLVKPL